MSDSPRRWLIAEDALKNRSGHWSEYISTFRRGLDALGHQVTVLVDSNAESHLLDDPNTHPALPDSIWHRMGDGAGKLTRYLRVPIHALETKRSIDRWLRQNEAPDVIFVPTVLVHHLLGWWRIYRRFLQNGETRLLLFFPNTPLTHNDETDQAMLGRDPTARLFGWLIRQLSDGVEAGKLVLGVETESMRDALTRATGVEFTYLPHCVEIDSPTVVKDASDEPLHFGCYGAARHEKGSDLLQTAILKHLRSIPETTTRFSIQWLDDFDDASGTTVSPHPDLLNDSRVTFIREYFPDGGYDRQLATTDVMLLPYREPYRYRVSRVVIEAMVRGMPVVATRQTTLWEQAKQFGAGLPCELNDPDSLAQAIALMESRFVEMKNAAEERSSLAQSHFSVRTFAEGLLTATQPSEQKASKI